MVLAATAPQVGGQCPLAAPAVAGTSCDFGFGLKNWFGTIVHSMILDYSGTTIIQQTPLNGLWSIFTMLTTMSLDDLETQGASIGFYPDDVNFIFNSSGLVSGAQGTAVGVNNNVSTVVQGAITGKNASGQQFSNKGLYERQNRTMNSEGAATGQIGDQAGVLLNQTSMDALYQSSVISRVNSTATTPAAIVYQIQAQIYLKHLHSFFSQIPLLKGVFFRLTLNINNTVMSLLQGSNAATTTNGWNLAGSTITCPLGGVNPIMLASSAYTAINPLETSLVDSAGGVVLANTFESSLVPSAPAADVTSLRVTLNVGNSVIDSTQRTQLDAAGSVVSTKLNSSCLLNVPAYTFNPSFEEAYLSKPVKTIMYTDIFQYTTRETGTGQFNYLITNGISNIKSVLVLPMLTRISGQNSTQSGATNLPPFQSPFDSCGGGTTAPLAALNNFNVVVAGQNMVYNQIQYDYQEFEQQLKGVNAINGGLVDGLTSGLIDFHKFQRMYRYYYVNCARMLPIDEAVPKSVSITGTNQCLSDITFYVFIEYGVQVSVDVLTGARV
jgi:hypothetical protein